MRFPTGVSDLRNDPVFQLPLPDVQLVGSWKLEPGAPHVCGHSTDRYNIKGPAELSLTYKHLPPSQTRSTDFSELESSWQLPLHEYDFVTSVAVQPAEHRHTKPGIPRDDLIHIATGNPIAIHTLDIRNNGLTTVSLQDVFPSHMTSVGPRVSIATMGATVHDTVLLHEKVTNIVLSVNIVNGTVMRLTSPYLPEVSTAQRTANSDQSHYTMCGQLSGQGQTQVTFYQPDSDKIIELNLLSGVTTEICVPFNIGSLHLMDDKSALLTDSNSQRRYLLHKTNDTYTTKPIHDSDTIAHIDKVSLEGLPQNILSTLTKEVGDNRLMAPTDSYATIATGLPGLQNECPIYTIPRTHPTNTPLSKLLPRPDTTRPHLPTEFHPACGHVIRVVATKDVPKDVREKSNTKNGEHFLEVVDLANQKLRYIPLPRETTFRSV